MTTPTAKISGVLTKDGRLLADERISLSFDEDLGGEFAHFDFHTPTLRKLGRFELKSVLGAGGFGKVYRAYDPQLACPAGARVLQSEPFATGSSSPVGLPNRKESFQRVAGNVVPDVLGLRQAA